MRPMDRRHPRSVEERVWVRAFWRFWFWAVEEWVWIWAFWWWWLVRFWGYECVWDGVGVWACW